MTALDLFVYIGWIGNPTILSLLSKNGHLTAAAKSLQNFGCRCPIQ